MRSSNGPADLSAAHARHDAVGARVVTTRLDGHPRGKGQFAHGVERGRHVATGRGVGRVEDLDERALAHRTPQQRRRGRRGCGCQRRRRPSAARSRIVPRSFWAMQPPDRDLETGPLLLQRLQLAECAVELEVGVLANRAGVEDDRRRPRRRSRRARGRRRPADRPGARSRARSSGSRRSEWRTNGALTPLQPNGRAVFPEAGLGYELALVDSRDR